MAERYVLKFSKTGYMRYISHLDLLRLFKRMFRTGGIEIRYSQGFNPHPKPDICTASFSRLFRNRRAAGF